MNDLLDILPAPSLLLAEVLAATHFVVMAVATGHVVLTKRDNRAAIGWVGIILLTPFVGAALYVMFGVNRIARKAKLLGRPSDPVSKVDLGHLRMSAKDVQETLGPHAEQLIPLADYVHRVTHQPLLCGNEVVPLTDGDLAYGAMLKAIDEAQHSVSLGTYIFDNDDAGRTFAAALSRATQRGVEVRVLIDDVGTRYTFPTIKKLLRESNVRFATFLPTLIPWKLNYSNLRNHRKIMVADGRIGFTGGMNIRQGHRVTNPGRYPIHDMHFQLRGPVVAQMQETFAQDWAFATGESLAGDQWFPQIEPAGPMLCRGIVDGPDINADKISLSLLGAIACARRKVTIITPYFLPDYPLIMALNVADLRGVDVRVILPERNNLRMVQWASTAQLWQVLKRGVRVFLTPEPFDHSKMMVVDDVWSLIGSANWDPRSLRLNFEFNVECYDRQLALQLQGIIDQKMQAAREITLSDVDGRPLWMRLRDGVARLATPYL